MKNQSPGISDWLLIFNRWFCPWSLFHFLSYKMALKCLLIFSNVVTNSLTFVKNLENYSDEYYRKSH